MGYIRNDLTFVHFDREYSAGGQECAAALEALRTEMPERFARLLVGPINPPTNGGEHWLFLPDGSKEGWEDSAEGDRWRTRFFEIIEPMRWGAQRVRVIFGDDDPVLMTGSNAFRSPATTGP